MLTSEPGCRGGVQKATQLRGGREAQIQPALGLPSDMLCLESVFAQKMGDLCPIHAKSPQGLVMKRE